MMEDQRNFIREELIKNGYNAEIVEDGIQVTVLINDLKLHLFCKLGQFFPYEIPSIFLSRDEWNLLPSMPHRYTNGSICTFDRSIAVPNINKPVQLVIFTLEKAKEIIKDGIIGNNHPEYMDEFLAYWKTKKVLRAQSFVDEISVCKDLIWIRNTHDSIITDSFDRSCEILKCVHGNHGNKPDEILLGILIPITGNESMIIPENDLDFINLIKNNTKFWQHFYSFMQKNISKKKFFVIISEQHKEESMLYGWCFNGPGVPNGFRKGHVNLSVAFGKSKNCGCPIAIDNCSQERLFRRGGDSHIVTVNNAVIVGCGSVGSVISEALLNYGTSNFTLVDNDILSYENIARHYAGYWMVGESKVNAIKTQMQLHNPNIVCEAINTNAFTYFEDEYTNINKKDLLVVAVASAPVELFLMEKINKGIINIPALIMWVEPYAIAGHGILINKPMDEYAELFNRETLEYCYGVLENPEQYSKRESGCQSSYMPYSSFSMKEIVYRILEVSLKDYYRTGKNYRLTWCGRLSEAKQKGLSINDFYKNKLDYSMDVERID